MACSDEGGLIPLARDASVPPRRVRSEQFRPVLCTGTTIGDPDCEAHYLLLGDVSPGLRLAYVAQPALNGLYFPLFGIEGMPSHSFEYGFDVERWADPTAPPVETRYIGRGIFPQKWQWAPFAIPSYQPDDFISLAFRVYPP